MPDAHFGNFGASVRNVEGELIMQPPPSAVFLIHLVQDVSVLRPLVFMSARDFGFDTVLLTSAKFAARDDGGIWRNELADICTETGARLETFRDEWEAVQHLTGQGLLFAASESDLPQHATAHNVFRIAPPSLVKVTLQHGFECVGFRHNADHVRAHGEFASFGADIICSWSDSEHLKSLAASQRGKLLVTGPTSVLQQPTGPATLDAKPRGLVCENLHSVRFGGATGPRSEFVDTFAEFSRLLSKRKRKITLRTHPGGRYILRNKVKLPRNVLIEQAPIYRLDLRRFLYGISAPSTILIEMLLAGIPTAVWRDGRGTIDTSNYEGLPILSSARELLDFAGAAEQDPTPFREQQERFLVASGMMLEPREVFRRFASLFDAAKRMEFRVPGSVPERERILFIANGNVPTLQLSFEKPLAPLLDRGEIVTHLLIEGDLNQSGSSVTRELNQFNPSAIIFCRYSGSSFEPIIEWARREQVPVIYHIDDDLLGVPREIGERKFAIHNAPDRRASVAELLNSADLIYASTGRLRERLLGYFPNLPIRAGDIYCSGAVLRRASTCPACTVGYMASADHAHNLEMILPAIEKLLDSNPQVRFELFGSIPVPECLARFGDRISTAPPVKNYGNFLNEFADSGWDVGICPLAPIDFNLMKANTKWVEYTSVGAAVVASRGTVYDECCAGGCGILADTVEEWFSALNLLVNDVDERLATVDRAQARLQRDYSVSRLREQVLEVVAQAHGAVRAKGSKAEGKRKQSIVS